MGGGNGGGGKLVRIIELLRFAPLSLSLSPVLLLLLLLLFLPPSPPSLLLPFLHAKMQECLVTQKLAGKNSLPSPPSPSLSLSLWLSLSLRDLANWMVEGDPIAISIFPSSSSPLPCCGASKSFPG